MKKKATLLLQHIETIYTMVPPHFACIHHGFIAFHHDYILAVGEGDGWVFVDKDTRIVEGRNHIAVPGFIDVSIQLEMSSQTLPTTLTKMREQGEIRMKNGTLIANTCKPFSKTTQKAITYLQVPYEIDYESRPYISRYPIVYPLESLHNKTYQRFCISCGHEACLDQLLCAQLCHKQSTSTPLHILAACTIYPARALQLKNTGCIKKGNIGNVLLLEGQSFEDILCRFHGNHHIQVIKEGTRILPNIII